MNKEVWKPVDGFEGYEVSNTGRVRSNKRINTKVLSPVRRGHNNPRLYVMLRKDNQSYSKYVSALVAQAFIDNPNGYHVVAFKDGNLTNNHVDNLEWTTRSEVMRGPRKEKVACKVNDCDGIAYCRGYCTTHYAGWYYNQRAVDGTYVAKKEIVGYAAAHGRVKVAKGRASTHTCECGQPATAWALQATADQVVRQANGFHQNMIYSLDINDYAAMCDTCHTDYDNENKDAFAERFKTATLLEVSQSVRGTGAVDADQVIADLKDGMTLKQVAAKHDIHYSYPSRIFLDAEGKTLREWKAANKVGASA